MKHYAIYTMMGLVKGEPELCEWVSRSTGKALRYARFDLEVVRTKSSAQAALEVRQIFEVSVWDEMMLDTVLSLQDGQGVQVVGDLDSESKQMNSGGLFYNIRMRARFVVPGVAPAPHDAGAAARKALLDGQAERKAVDNYGKGTYVPPANAKQAQTPAPLPHEDEEDLPF